MELIAGKVITHEIYVFLVSTVAIHGLLCDDPSKRVTAVVFNLLFFCGAATFYVTTSLNDVTVTNDTQSCVPAVCGLQYSMTVWGMYSLCVRYLGCQTYILRLHIESNHCECKLAVTLFEFSYPHFQSFHRYSIETSVELLPTFTGPENQE